MTQRMEEFDAVETRHVEIEHQNVGKPARQICDRHAIGRIKAVARVFDDNFLP